MLVQEQELRLVLVLQLVLVLALLLVQVLALVPVQAPQRVRALRLVLERCALMRVRRCSRARLRA